jgi:hypothetical protein
MAKPRKRTKEISTQTAEKTQPEIDGAVTAADLTGGNFFQIDILNSC